MKRIPEMEYPDPWSPGSRLSTMWQIKIGDSWGYHNFLLCGLRLAGKRAQTGIAYFLSLWQANVGAGYGEFVLIRDQDGTKY